MKTTLFLFIFLCIANISYSIEYPIVSIVKEFDSTGSKKNLQKDYYLKIGKVQGLKVGSILKVLRKVPFKYNLIIGNDTEESMDFKVNIGRLKVVFVEEEMSIARVHSLIPGERLPVLKNDSIIVGDFVEIVKEDEREEKE